MKVLLDTNMLLYAVAQKVDLQALMDGKELLTLQNCVAELEKLGKGKTRSGMHARVALELLKKKNIKVLQSGEKNTDRAIIRYARDNNIIVATNDRVLIKSLKTNGIRVIRLRQKRLLIEE